MQLYPAFIFILKKNCYIFFTLLAFAALFAAYPVVKWQQWYAQREMRDHILMSNLPDSLVEHFTDIDKDVTVEWKEEGRECYINGKLYDVISTESACGHKVFHCICDEQEEKAVNVLNSISEQDLLQHIPGKKLALKLIRELFSLLFIPAENYRLYCFSQGAVNIFSFPCCALQEYHREIHIPPPEIV